VIEIPRCLARQLRAVLRRTLMDLEPRGAWPLVLFQADESGLTVHAVQGDLGVRYHEPGPRSPETIAFRSSMLAEFEGRTEQPVALEEVSAGKGQARWSDGAVPRITEFETVTLDNIPAFPALPKRFTPLPVGFLRALGEAAQSTGLVSQRPAVARVLLGGKAGEVVATDGRQLLVQRGFPLPWQEEVLVPRLPVLSHLDLAPEGPVGLGRSNDHVTLRAGPWTFALAIDRASRFPNVGAVIPKSAAVTSALQLHPEDAACLAAALPKVPVREGDAPVTLDLGGRVGFRARAEDQGPVTEAVLSRSTASGQPVRLCLDRRHLLRALKLGFTELAVVSPDKPLAWRDPDRIFICMPLDPKAALPPQADVLRIESMADTAPTLSPPERSDPPMPEPSTTERSTDNHRLPGPPDRNGGLEELIVEADALRGLLGEAAARTTRLLGALKQHRRQARAVQAAMASLRDLDLAR